MKRRRYRERKRQSRKGQDRKTGRRVAWLVVVNLLVLVLLLGLLELGARLFFPRSLEAVFDNPKVFVRGRPFVEPHERRGFRLKPGYQGPICRVNKDGFRGPEVPQDVEERQSILVLGESSTFGWNVDDDETYPACLQRELDPSLSIYVINAGVPSYTSAQVQLYVEELLQRFEPSLVLVTVMWNDALFSCIDNWLPELLIIQQPAPWRQALLRNSGLYRAFALRGSSVAMQSLNQEALVYYEKNLSRIVDLCRNTDARLAFVRPAIQVSHIPAEGMKVGPRTVPKGFFIEVLSAFSEAIEKVAAGHGVELISHRLDIESSPDASLFLDPAHPNAEGYRLQAKDVASVIQELIP